MKDRLAKKFEGYMVANYGAHYRLHCTDSDREALRLCFFAGAMVMRRLIDMGVDNAAPRPVIAAAADAAALRIEQADAEIDAFLASLESDFAAAQFLQ